MRLSDFLAQIRISRHEIIALISIFGLYAFGLTLRHLQATSVEYDEAYYDRLDSLTGQNALMNGTRWVVADTVPKPDSSKSKPPVDDEEPIVLQTGRMNVNLASERQLTQLPGIGPSLAGRIVAYRDVNGAFLTIDEMSKVRGIGPKTIERFRGLVIVD